ncbi:unnamed protein product [Closterium sp. Yama58-4]|nr:unnamed protein product [Closterium sp. Yama58-4]
MEVLAETIERSFKTCGIGNRVDSAKDHLILAHMQDAAQVEVHDDAHAAGDIEEWINPLYMTGAQEEEETGAMLSDDE